MAKYGKAKIVARIAGYRRTHPSEPEKELHKMLFDLGFGVCNFDYYTDTSDKKLTDAYTEHMSFPDDNERAYILDVAWPALKLYLEVDGPVHDIFMTPERAVYAGIRQADLDIAGWKGYHIRSEDLHT